MRPTARFAIPALLLALAAGGVLAQSGAPTKTGTDPALQAVLESSRDKKHGVYVHVNGSRIGGVVREIAGETVVLSNREYERIVVRLDRIDAVEGN